MDEETMLTHHEALLVQELALVRAKLAYVRIVNADSKKGNITPCLISKGNNVGIPNAEPKKDICSPSSSQSKEQTIPEQTAPGKETTKPLMADALPKSIKEDSTSNKKASEKIKDLINLRPNQGIQSPLLGVKSGEEKSSEGIPIPNKNSKPYYVVFNGPNRGIFENWEVAKKATEGISNIKHQKYKNILEARTAANVYCKEQFLDESSFQIICSADVLRPADFAAALKRKKETKVSLGRLPQKIKFEISSIENHISLDIQAFEYLYKLARTAGEKELISDKFFTRDGKNLSYFNFIKGAKPEFISEAFAYGLIKIIYPSSNLLELKLLPIEVYKTIKNFKAKIVKNDNDIFVKILSTIPIWDDKGVTYAPQHLIHIGVSTGEQYTPSIPMKCSMNKEDFLTIGKQKITEFINQLFEFKDEDQIFVNYEDRNCLIYSKTGRMLNPEDKKKILNFQQRFFNNECFEEHDKRICPTIRQRTSHICTICDPNQSGPSTTKEDALPTQTDKGKGISFSKENA